jgi:hypothetical protein
VPLLDGLLSDVGRNSGDVDGVAAHVQELVLAVVDDRPVARKEFSFVSNAFYVNLLSAHLSPIFKTVLSAGTSKVRPKLARLRKI